MVDPSTSRLYYEFLPAAKQRVHAHSPVRDIGTACDLAVLQTFTGGSEFDGVIDATLDHYLPMLDHETYEEPEAWCFLDPERLGEPSSVAHSAFLLMALAAWERFPREGEKEALLAELAAGIVYFAPHGLPDVGWTLYGGEATLGVLTAYRRLGDERLWQSGACGSSREQTLSNSNIALPRMPVDPDELVFFANWQSQASRLLAQQTADPQQRAAMCAYVHGLQDAIQHHRFYEAVWQAPGSMAVVEVACALEALADALALAMEAGDAKLQRRYGAQVATLVKGGPGVPAEAVGGFGHMQASAVP
eukprot:scaffold17.g542.t1